MTSLATQIARTTLAPSSALWRTPRQWLARRSARRALLALDDLQLKDIGLARSDIEAVVNGDIGWRPHRFITG